MALKLPSATYAHAASPEQNFQATNKFGEAAEIQRFAIVVASSDRCPSG